MEMLPVQRRRAHVGVRRVPFDDVLNDRHVALVPERLNAGEHFVEHRPQREKITSVVDVFSVRLLGRHIKGCAQNGIRRCVLRCALG